MIIYSIDHYHMPFSTTVFPSLEKQSSQPLLGAIILDTFDHWIQKIILEKTLANLTQSAETGWSYPGNFVEPGKSLSEFLYGIETLRKRGQENHD